MVNFLNLGDVIDVTNTSSSVTIASGSVNIVGKLIGVAVADIAPLASGGLAVKGIFQLTKKTSLVITQGDQVYWNISSNYVTKTATDVPLGIATTSQLTNDTIVNVKLAGNALEAGNVAADVAALTGTLTGTVDGALVDVAATAAATAGGSGPTAAQVDTGIATAVASIVTGVNTQNKEFQTTINAILTALKGAGLMA